jgi:hypothetical protein
VQAPTLKNEDKPYFRVEVGWHELLLQKGIKRNVVATFSAYLRQTHTGQSSQLPLTPTAEMLSFEFKTYGQKPPSWTELLARDFDFLVRCLLASLGIGQNELLAKVIVIWF